MRHLSLLVRNKIFRFLVGGTLGAIVQIGLLFLFTHVTGLWYIYSALIAFVCSQTVGFLMQKFWTFQNRENSKVHHQALGFVSIGLLNLVLNTCLLYIMVDLFYLNYVAGQVISSILLAFISFYVYGWIFKKRVLT